MNQNIVLMKINSALNVLRVVQGVTPKLSARAQREMPLGSVRDAIRGLEIAKAELTGAAWPEAPVGDGPDMSEFIEA